MTRIQKLSPILVSALLVACSQAQPMAQSPVLPEAQALVVQAGLGDRVARLNLQAMAPYALQAAGTVHRWVPGDVMHYEVELKQRSASDPNQYDTIGAGLSIQVAVSGGYGAGTASFQQLRQGSYYRAFVKAMGRAGGQAGSGGVVQMNAQAASDHVDFDFTSSNDTASEISRSVTVQLDNTPFSGTGQLAFASPLPGSYLAPSTAPTAKTTSSEPMVVGEFALSNPRLLSMDPNGKLWIGHNFGPLVTHLDSDGSLLGSYNLPGQAQVMQAMPDGSVWAHTGGGSLTHLGSDGSTLPGKTMASSVKALTHDSQGNLLVWHASVEKLDASLNTIAHFTPNLWVMTGAAMLLEANGRLWLASLDMSSVLALFDSNNTQLVHHNLELKAQTVDAQGHLWALLRSGGNTYIRHYDQDGAGVGADINLGMNVGGLAQMDVDAQGRFWVAVNNTSTVHHFSSSGQQLKSFNISSPRGLKVAPNGNVWVLSTGDSKIYLIR